MGVEKARQIHATKYASKFATFTSFVTNIKLKLKGSSSSNTEQMSIKQEINDMYAHLVEADQRWETRVSFSMMVTDIILNTMSLNGSTTTDIDGLVLFLLKGEGAPVTMVEKMKKGQKASYPIQFEGLLSFLSHGDPVNAKDHPVESLSLAMSNWASASFQPDVKANEWIEQGMGVMESAFNEQVHQIASKFEGAIEFEISPLFQGLNTEGLQLKGVELTDVFGGVNGIDLPNSINTAKIGELTAGMKIPAGARLKIVNIKNNAAALESIAKGITAVQEQLKPSAKSIREAVNKVVNSLDPLLEKGRVVLDTVASLNPMSQALGKLDVLDDLFKDKLNELFSMKVIFSSFATDATDTTVATDATDAKDATDATDATDMNFDGAEFKIDLLGIQDTSKENIGLALDHIVTATNGVAAKFKRWSGGLSSFAEGFEGDVSKPLKTVVKRLDGQKVDEAISNHAKVRRKLVDVSGLGNCWFVTLYLILKQPSHDPSHHTLGR